MITIKEIAEKMNVSPTTVANVIHGRTSKVSKENVERIQKALKEYNYVPKMGLEALTKGKTRIIMVIAHTTKRYERTVVGDPFYSYTLGVLEDNIRKAGYYMMMYIDENVDNIFKTALSWNVAGIIAVTLAYRNYEKLCSLVDCPVVGIDTYAENNAAMPNKGYHVILDDLDAGRQIGNYLIQSGFRNIMVISDSKFGSSGERTVGVKQILHEKGLPCDKYHFLLLDPRKTNHNNQLRTLFPLAGKDYVLFCTSDQLAFTVIGFLNEQGFKVPEDFSVCGFDDNPYAEFSIPKLTTMHQDIGRKAQLASDLLFRLLDGESIEDTNILLPVELVVRKSVRPPKNPVSN